MANFTLTAGADAAGDTAYATAETLNAGDSLFSPGKTRDFRGMGDQTGCSPWKGCCGEGSGLLGGNGLPGGKCCR